MTEEVTARDAADDLGVHRDTVRLWIHRGKMAGVKRGRDWFVTSAEVERMREKRAGKVEEAK